MACQPHVDTWGDGLTYSRRVRCRQHHFRQRETRTVQDLGRQPESVTRWVDSDTCRICGNARTDG